ncbi:MAG: DUF1611 domain-containing protein, partial [Chloroflexi bacterium]|nr:DUF1611 domain-containing protein [Chloroflexota bacterium]
TQVIAIALSHEGINDVEVLKFIEDYEERLALPTTDVLKYGTQKLIQMLSDRFPTIYQKIKAMSLESIPAEDLLVPERLW